MATAPKMVFSKGISNSKSRGDCCCGCWADWLAFIWLRAKYLAELRIPVCASYLNAANCCRLWHTKKMEALSALTSALTFATILSLSRLRSSSYAISLMHSSSSFTSKWWVGCIDVASVASLLLLLLLLLLLPSLYLMRILLSPDGVIVAVDEMWLELLVKACGSFTFDLMRNLSAFKLLDCWWCSWWW